MSLFIESMYLSIKKSFIYRADIIIKLFTGLIQLLISLFLWKYIFRYHSSIESYSLDDMLIYYLIMTFLTNIFFPSNIFTNSQEVKSGNIAIKLLKPIHINIINFLDFLGSKFIDIVLLTISIVVISIMGLVQFNLLSIISILLLFLNFFCLFIFGQLISNIAYYITEVWPLRPLYRSFYLLFSGGIIPLDLMPERFKGFMSLSPFSLFGFSNANVLMGRSQDLERSLILSIIYSLIFLILHVICQRNALRKLEVVGVWDIFLQV